MLNPIYIQSILKQNNFDVDYINGANTGGIQIQRFAVYNGFGEKEIVTVSYVKHLGNKVEIETNNGTDVLGEVSTLNLEETIRFAVAMTPDNRLPHLINPICFTSFNFPQLNEFEIDEERIEKDFLSALEPMNADCERKDIAFLTFTFPKNKYSSLISNLFEKVKSFHSIEEKNNRIKVVFSSFCDNLSKESSAFHLVKKSLEEIGVNVEITEVFS